MRTLRLCLVYLLLGLLVPTIINAQCPSARIVSGVRCGTGRRTTECPTGSTCNRGTCCWEERSPVASPCDYPMMRQGEFVTCDLPGQGQSQGRRRSCPGQCHTCRDLTGMGMGLCCPETGRQGCERASPNLVAFQQEVQRIRTGSGGTSTGSRSTGSASAGNRRIDQFGTDTGNRFRSSVRSDFGGSPGVGRDTRVITSRGQIRNDPRGMSSRSRSTVPEGPCGRDIRPLSYCNRRMPMPCPRGSYCVSYNFMEVCCPLGTGPAARQPIDRRFGPSRLSRDSFTSRSGDRFGSGSSGRFGGDRTRSIGSSGQLDAGTVGGRIDRPGSSLPSGEVRETSVADFDTRMFGPRPREDFPGGPIDTRNTPRDSCPARVTCSRSLYEECYTDNDCSVPLRCCSTGPTCSRRCLSDKAAQS